MYADMFSNNSADGLTPPPTVWDEHLHSQEIKKVDEFINAHSTTAKLFIRGASWHICNTSCNHIPATPNKHNAICLKIRIWDVDDKQKYHFIKVDKDINQTQYKHYCPDDFIKNQNRRPTVCTK